MGSRWANVHWGVKTRGKAGEEYAAPPVPDGFNALKHAEQVLLTVLCTVMSSFYRFTTLIVYIFKLMNVISFAENVGVGE